MQITLVQAEIEAALRAHILSRFNTTGDVPMTIEFSATRGADGFKVTIDIAHEHLFPSPSRAPVVHQATPVPTPAPEAAEPVPVVEAPATPAADANPPRSVGAQAVADAYLEGITVRERLEIDAGAIGLAAEVAAEVEAQAEAEAQPELVQEPEPTVEVAEIPVATPTRKPVLFGKPKLVTEPVAEAAPLATTAEEAASMDAQIAAEIAAGDTSGETGPVTPPFDGGTPVASTDVAPAAPAGEKRSLFKGLKRPTS